MKNKVDRKKTQSHVASCRVPMKGEASQTLSRRRNSGVQNVDNPKFSTSTPLE